MYDDFVPEKSKKYWSVQEARLLIRKFCAYQERSHQEVRNKLLQHGIYGDVLEDIIADLITENFLDEERFACSYARGKFRMKQWGRIRIQQELKLKGTSAYSIKMAMKEIPEAEYLDALAAILAKKSGEGIHELSFEEKSKVSQYAHSKGYEWDIIELAWKKLTQMEED
jgi:regulatory protein